MDFRKAFDVVPHKRLISKLKSYNLNQQLIKWIESFLTGRSQQVVINNSKSTLMNVTSGIPQGSVLGSLLFVIFIDDLLENVKSEIYLLADDTKIYQTIIHTSDDQSGLQADLDKLRERS